MPDRVVPVLRLAVLCEDVEYDADGQPFSLQVPVHTIRLPAGWVGPYKPPTTRGPASPAPFPPIRESVVPTGPFRRGGE